MDTEADYSTLSLEELLATPATSLHAAVAKKMVNTLESASEDDRLKMLQKVWDKVDRDHSGSLD
eukprot:SAG11_NODE_9014_length_953_cov_1.985948_1_plen_63_part_01